MTIEHNKIKTSKHPKFQIALAIVFVVSLAFLIFMILKDEIFVIKLTTYVMCGLFVVLSAIMLIHLNLDFLIFEEDNHIISHRFLKKTKIKINELEYYTEKDGLVTLRYNGKLFGSFDSTDPNFAIMMNILDSNKISKK